jgi:hypothetical protein
MRKYFINSKQVTIYEWREEFAKHADASVILRTNKLPEQFTKEEPTNIISPERVREIRANKQL